MTNMCKLVENDRGCEPDAWHRCYWVSCRRAELLQKELQWMADNRESAHDAVGSKVDYWSL